MLEIVVWVKEFPIDGLSNGPWPGRHGLYSMVLLLLTTTVQCHVQKLESQMRDVAYGTRQYRVKADDRDQVVMVLLTVVQNFSFDTFYRFFG